MCGCVCILLRLSLWCGAAEVRDAFLQRERGVIQLCV